MKKVFNRKITKKLFIYLFLLVVIQVNIIIGISKISENKDAALATYKNKLAENVTQDDIEGLNISYPVYTEGDVIYFDPVTTNKCNADTFSVSNVTNGTSTCYRWRVIETEDSSDKSVVNIQLDHNIGDRIDWITSEDKTQIINNSSERTVSNTTAASIGPMSALKMLQTSTNTWERVPMLNYEYDTSDVINPTSSYISNYGKLTCVNGECKNGKNEVLVQNLRTRLITPQELTKIAKKNFAEQNISDYSTRNLADWKPDDYETSYYTYANNNNKSILWLMENLHSDSSLGWTTYNGRSASGYWTMAPTAKSSSQAWDVSDGMQMYGGIATVLSSSIGVRPVVQYNKLYNAYLITYNDENRITKKVIFEGDKASSIDAKGKQGYDFLHWSSKKDGKNAFDFTKNITSNTTLYAVYNKKGCSIVEGETAVNYIEDLYEQNALANNLIYDKTVDNNLRYYNSNPNNYIKFNGELWRIVGIFNVENKTGEKNKRLKIVRDESIGRYSWDTSHHGSGSDGPGNKNSAYGINEWSQADLMYLLNPGYEDHKEPNYYNDTFGHIVYDDEYLVNNSLYYNSKSGKCFVTYNNGNENCNFTNTGIKEDSKKYIDTVKWNTGAINKSASSMNSYDLYNVERGNATGKDGITTSDIASLDNVERTTTWIGKIGLLYASDTVFSAGDYTGSSHPNRDECLSSSLTSQLGACTTTNNWLKNIDEPTWSITSTNGLAYTSEKKPYYVIALSGSYYNSSANNAASPHPVKPALYLKPNVKFTTGNGSKSNPYEIDFLEEPVCNSEVTFSDEGRITKKTVLTGNKVNKIESQGKDGYEFKYWSKDKTTEFDFDTAINEDITLYAVYESKENMETDLSTYTVTFDSNGGTKVNSITKNKSEQIGTLPKSKRSGYTFVGWYVDNKQIDSEFKSQTDVTAVAKWVKDSNNPKTSDNVMMYIISLIISTIILCITLKIYINNKLNSSN